MMRSLKWRLLAWTAGGMVLLLTLFAAVVYVVIERALAGGFDDALAATARAIAASVKQDEKKIEIEFNEEEMPEFHRAARPDYYELWQGGGAVLKRSASLGNRDLDRLDGAPGIPRFQSVTLPDGRPGRAVVFAFLPRADEEQEGEHDEPDSARPAVSRRPVTLVVARETAGLDAQLASLKWILALAGAGTAAVMLLVAAVVVRQGLAPLGTLADRIAAVREEDLATRIPADGLPSEMAPVAARLNELLGRLDAAFRRERTLTADVAHELRTPLAGLRSTVEVALSRSRPNAEYQQALGECLEIVRQTQGMIDNLLSLARLEGGQVTLHPRDVQVAELVESLWRPHAAAAQARGIAHENRLPADLRCTADRDMLALVFANLLANAAEYTEDRGRVEVAGRRLDGTVEVTVANTGCRLTAEDATHVFERLWRGDSARAGTGAHCGVGLSLVARAVHALGGSVSAEVAGGRFIVRVRLPAG